MGYSIISSPAVTTEPVRQALMPAINRATDAGLRQRFESLHRMSVVVTFGHIAAARWLPADLA